MLITCIVLDGILVSAAFLLSTLHSTDAGVRELVIVGF